MDFRITKHGKPQKNFELAVGYRCSFCECEFYVDNEFMDNIIIGKEGATLTELSDFETTCQCPECKRMARQVDLTYQEDIFGKQSFWRFITSLFECSLERYKKIEKALAMREYKSDESTL